VKIIAIADQHGYLDFTLPEGDIVIHAGDVCPDFGPRTQTGSARQEAWLRKKWLPWVGNDLHRLYATFGNHDFVSRHFGNPFFVDRSIERDGYKIWFSPWSNQFLQWAWMKEPAELAEVYAKIPDDVDVLVSHQPPYGYGDQVPPQYIGLNEDPEGHVGSKELLKTIERVAPKVVICGHIHNGRGTYQHRDTLIYNVSLVNEAYQRVYEPVEIYV
jgi:predicted phosphodiesterase